MSHHYLIVELLNHVFNSIFNKIKTVFLYKNRSILRTAKVDEATLKAYIDNNNIRLDHKKEWKLGKMISRFPEITVKCMEELTLHPLCEYLYELAGTLTEFYDACYCITKDKETGAIKSVDMNRIALLEAVSRIFAAGFHILGIKPVSRM